MLGGAAVAAGPGVAIRAGLAIAVVPGRCPPGGLAASRDRDPGRAGRPPGHRGVAAPQARPGRQPGPDHHRRDRRAAPPGPGAARSPSSRRRRIGGRPVVLHDQGVPAGGGIDLYLTVVPILVAIPVVVIMLRLYPLAIRGLLALSARGTGATGFVALSRAARSSLTGALPAFALVLALSLATFAGMVSQGIARGEITASWHATGADVMIAPGRAPRRSRPAAVKAIAAVPGVRHATEVWNTNWFTPFGQPVTVVRRGPGRLRGPGRRHPVPGRSRPAGSARRARRRCPSAPPCRCWPRRRPPPSSAAADPAQHAVREGTARGAGRGHRDRHPRPARGRVVRDHAAARRCPGRPAQPGPTCSWSPAPRSTTPG